MVEYPTLAYMKLAPERWRFGNTLLHETGHIVLAALAGGDRIPARRLASIPHTTAALTDRGRAFNEGFAIHLETLAAHLSDEQDVRKRYRHEGFDFGGSSLKSAEYFKHAADLLSFSQTIARYYEVRENNFAFASAFREPDYLRVQMEKARDFSTLRNANQLLQSEGFYASFFFSYTMRGEETPTREVIDDRQNKMMDALAEMFAAHPMDTESPHLLRFVETFMRMYPSHGGEVVDVLLDLSHGVFVDAEAEALWKDFYLAALRLDMANLPRDRVTKARDDWRAAVLKDPKILYSRLGPQLRCMVPSLTVLLAALGQPAPLSFDVNTAEEGIIRMIPGITDAEVKRWLSRREEAPFAGVDDFKTRSELSAGCLDGMKLDSGR